MNKSILKIIFIVNLIFISPAKAIEYNFLDMDCVEIPLRIEKKITTSLRNKSHENEKLKFVVANNVFHNGQMILQKGTPVDARLEIITTRGFAGVPAEIFITDFDIPNIDGRKLEQPISVRGFSTMLLILPIKWALTPFPPLGSVTNIIVGGNASLKPDKTIYLNYYPDVEIRE